MAELAEAWEDYKQKILKGSTRDLLTKEEAKIHSFQDKYGYEKTDFEARWKKNVNVKETTLSGPPPPETKEVDTTAKYEAEFDEKELSQIDRLTTKAMAYKKVIADKVIKADGSYAKNPAATGQIINFVFALLNLENGKK